jgi:MoxR-like ATPase
LHQSGTFPLPESQLDRFMMRLSLGYPTLEAERLLLQGGEGGTQSVLAKLSAVVSLKQLKTLQKIVHQVNVSDNVVDYLQRLLAQTRDNQEFTSGLSPRAGLAWLHCAKAWALLQQRDYVIPDDLQAVMLPVVAHRLLPKESLDSAASTIQQLLQHVAVVE